MAKSREGRLDQNVQDAVLPILEALNTARALTVTILLRHREYKQLCELKAVPSHYDCVQSYVVAVCATDILRKYQGIPAVADTRQAAVESFWTSERRCALTNTRLRDLTENCIVESDNQPPMIHSVVGYMREFTRVVLGKVPSNLNFFVGPGATVSDGARLATLPDKFSSLPSVTSEAMCILPLWDHTAWARAHYRRQHARTSPPVQLVRGNKFFTVVKNAETDRGACKGPSINVSAQLGVGRHIRACLAYRGIDLQVGQALHQRLAREGSINDESVTVDLRSASDTVARLLVKLAVIPAWHDVLVTLREPLTEIDGKFVFLEKFSAMGNGYTFELETLVFLAIIAAAVRLHDDDVFRLIANHEVSVYGDDIIVPKRYAATVVSLLKFFGMELNPNKTFLEGSFRESCGGDYFLGEEVTPFRLQEEILEPHQWFSFHNGVVLLGERLKRATGRSYDFTTALRRIVGNVPTPLRRLKGPRWLGDVVLHDVSYDWRQHLQQRGDRWWLPTWQPYSARLEWKHWYPDVVLASALYGALSDGVTPRGVTGHRVKRVGRPMFAWVDLHQVSPLLKRILRVTGAPS